MDFSIILLVVVMFSWLMLSIFEHFEIISYWGNSERSQRNWHILTASIRLLLSTYIFYIVFGLQWMMIKALYVFLLMWWILFDIMINLKRKKPIFYVGYNNFIDKSIRTATLKINKLLGWIGYKKYVEVVKVNMLLKLFILITSFIIFL
jgi:hypothetical protein